MSVQSTVKQDIKISNFKSYKLVIELLIKTNPIIYSY